MSKGTPIGRFADEAKPPDPPGIGAARGPDELRSPERAGIEPARALAESEVRYAVPSRATLHVVADLAPGARHAVTITAVRSKQGPLHVIRITSAPAGPFAASPAGVLSFRVDAKGTLVHP